MRKVDLNAKVCVGECDHLPHGACKKCIVEALESYAAEVRKEALEEAVKRCERNRDNSKGVFENGPYHAHSIDASDIRALAEKRKP